MRASREEHRLGQEAVYGLHVNADKDFARDQALVQKSTVDGPAGALGKLQSKISVSFALVRGTHLRVCTGHCHAGRENVPVSPSFPRTRGSPPKARVPHTSDPRVENDRRYRLRRPGLLISTNWPSRGGHVFEILSVLIP